jgi:hypothetical protein
MTGSVRLALTVERSGVQSNTLSKSKSHFSEEPILWYCPISIFYLLYLAQTGEIWQGGGYRLGVKLLFLKEPISWRCPFSIFLLLNLARTAEIWPGERVFFHLVFQSDHCWVDRTTYVLAKNNPVTLSLECIFLTEPGSDRWDLTGEEIETGGFI